MRARMTRPKYRKISVIQKAGLFGLAKSNNPFQCFVFVVAREWLWSHLYATTKAAEAFIISWQWQDSLSMITDIVPIHSWSLDKRTLLKDWILRTKIASLHIWWCENCNYYLWLQYADAVLHISCLPSLISISNELDRPGLHCNFPLSRRAATPKLKYHGPFTIALGLVHQYVQCGTKV